MTIDRDVWLTCRFYLSSYLCHRKPPSDVDRTSKLLSDSESLSSWRVSFKDVSVVDVTSEQEPLALKSEVKSAFHHVDNDRIVLAIKYDSVTRAADQEETISNLKIALRDVGEEEEKVLVVKEEVREVLDACEEFLDPEGAFLFADEYVVKSSKRLVRIIRICICAI